MECHECGADAVHQELLPNFDTTIYGLPLTLKNAVKKLTCSNCGATRYRFPSNKDHMIEKSLAFARLQVPIILSGSEIRFLRNTLNMDQEAFCEQVMPGAQVSTLSRWENDKQRPGGFAELLLRSNIAALIAEDAPGMEYNPKFAVGMKLVEGEIGQIAMEQIKININHQIKEAWSLVA